MVSTCVLLDHFLLQKPTVSDLFIFIYLFLPLAGEATSLHFTWSLLLRQLRKTTSPMVGIFIPLAEPNSALLIFLPLSGSCCWLPFIMTAPLTLVYPRPASWQNLLWRQFHLQTLCDCQPGSLSSLFQYPIRMFWIVTSFSKDFGFCYLKVGYKSILHKCSQQYA